MKTSYFRRLALLLALFIPLVLQAQQPPQPCNIVITGDFESQCVLPLGKYTYYTEYGDVLVACRGMQITYTAAVNTGGAAVSSWTWSVDRATSVNDHHNGSITVIWGTDGMGHLSVRVVTSTGDSCEKSVSVLLVDPPAIASSSTPAYEVDAGGAKTLYVCKNASVDFTDLSTTTHSDIVGHYWESTQGGTASTPNYHVDGFAYEDFVYHRVYNNCGCYSEEEIHVVVLTGDTLDLGCYGTVCEGSIVTYTANNLPCSNYYWYVEGGTIQDGQGSQQVTVQWGTPADGYGVIGIDGDLCGNGACPAMLSKKIPVISDGLTIQGQYNACVGEAVVYRLPLFGSTHYQWTITPSSGVDTVPLNGANERMYIFNQAGTYHITVQYECDFLECGLFESDTLTVRVDPNLAITGNDRICVGSTCHLTTDPSTLASWKVLKIDNNYQHLYSLSRDCTIFSHTFNQPGRYLVLAANSANCHPAEFILTVEAAPPAPTAADMDPGNPTVACLGSAILLKGTPSNPDYSLIWEPSCSEGSPQSVSGSEVTISYGNAVCGVDVYNYDRVLGCRSTNHYTHPVSQFQLAQHTLPTQITVCPGTLLDWTTSVPNQDNVVYEWRLQDLKQYCASMQGSRFSNAIRLQVNELAPNSYPTTFYIQLIRTYCSSLQDVHTVYITIDTVPAIPALSMNLPDTVCAGTSVQLTGQGCGNGVSQWRIQDDDHTYTGNPINYSFTHAGNASVTYMCNTYGACTNREYISQASATVYVRPAPPATGIRYNGTHVFVVPTLPPGYSYSWLHTTATDSIVPAISGVHLYSCTVTSQTAPHCSKTLYVDTDTLTTPSCIDLPIVFDGINYCTKTVSFHVASPQGQVEWGVSGGEHGDPEYSGTSNENITIPVMDVGDYLVGASIDGSPCYFGSTVCTVDFLPDFSFEKRCDTIVIHNNSKYLDGSKTLQLSVNGTPLLNSTVSFAEHKLYTGNGGTYVFSLTGYDNLSTLNCPLDTITIGNTGGAQLSIAFANPTTCDNTPIELTLSASPAAISHVLWNFGDGSHLDTTGDSVFHTFSNALQQAGGYHVTAHVVDTNGCSSYGSDLINSDGDPLVGSVLSKTSPTFICCPNTANEIEFRAAQFNRPYHNPTIYNWSMPPTPSVNYNQHDTYYTDDYSVFVVDNSYCQAKAMCNVGFLNQPDAVIAKSSSPYCVGEKIKLYGDPGSDTTNYTFLWTITDSLQGTSTTSSYSRTSFTPPHAGAYHISLSITDNVTGCSDIDYDTIRIDPVPPAPSVLFGSNECMHNPPVNLVGSSAVTNAMHWSNGNTGIYADYFTPGPATAWYYHPITGCKSEEANVFINPEPDFDALLTGCYEHCKRFIDDHGTLPVWGLYAGRGGYEWSWYYDWNIVDGGIQMYPDYSLQLPVLWEGDYWLDVGYNNGHCQVSSPHLTINWVEECRCDLEVGTRVEWYLKECRLFYDVTVTICNKSNAAACIDRIDPLFDPHNYDITNSTFTSQTITPGNCCTFTMTIEPVHMIPVDSISFRILDGCNYCTTDFSIDLTLDNIKCEDTLWIHHINIPHDMVSDAAAYVDFSVSFINVQNVLAFWVEPPLLLDYIFNSSSGILRGLYMIDRGVLSQLALADSSICFHAITCRNDTLCHREYCIAASDIYQLLSERRELPDIVNVFDSDSVHTKSAKSQAVGEPLLRLVPNPTAGEVQVMGATGEVVEVLVLDMKGRQVACFDHSDRFDISSLPSGAYIVRLRTQSGEDSDEITYLKLVKE